MLKLHLFLIGVLFSGAVFSYSFVPSEFEFESWDMRCKALYLSTGVGRGGEFSNRVPSAVVWKWRKQADIAGGGPWHFCQGVALLMREKMSVDIQQKSIYIADAITEINYTRNNSPKNSADRLEATVYLAEAFRRKKSFNEALDLLRPFYKKKTKYELLYSVLYFTYRDKGMNDEALKVLLAAIEDLDDVSAEIYYFLGLEFLGRKNIDKASEYADKAYSLGYPLQGLKNKLNKVID